MANRKATAKDLKGKKFVTILGDEFNVSDHFNVSDFVVVKQGRGDSLFIRHDPLLRVAKNPEVLGILGKKVDIHQCPEKVNEWSATATVTYQFGDDDRKMTWASSADCRKSNARGGFATYPTAMAETRASARALRFALGVEFCSAEEIADLESMTDETFTDPIEDSQVTVIKNKLFKQYGFTLEDVKSYISKQYERDIDLLEEIYKGEAAELIQSFHRRKKPVDKE